MGRVCLIGRETVAAAYDWEEPVYICPNCKDRSVDIDGFEGLTGSDALQCRRCGFGFIFQLLEDYYPAPSTGFIVCDQEARVLAAGRGVFELTGYQERELMGRDVGEALSLSDQEPIGIVREWGVRKLGLELELSTRAAIRKPVTVDLFPAYDEDGGLLVALTPRTPVETPESG
jgi:DNA-directed RNA polymerase subunit RPC12/RpoP